MSALGESGHFTDICISLIPDDADSQETTQNRRQLFCEADH